MKNTILKTAQDDVLGEATQLHVPPTAVETEENPTLQNSRISVGLDGSASLKDPAQPPEAPITASGNDENSAAFLKQQPTGNTDSNKR